MKYVILELFWIRDGSIPDCSRKPLLRTSLGLYITSLHGIGVYKNGGPTNVDNGTSDLSNITDRSAADVRGVKK